MRTVRAFASESTECERFLAEIEDNGILHKKLGFGIGLFQVCIYWVNLTLLFEIIMLFLGREQYFLKWHCFGNNISRGTTNDSE